MIIRRFNRPVTTLSCEVGRRADFILIISLVVKDVVFSDVFHSFLEHLIGIVFTFRSLVLILTV